MLKKLFPLLLCALLFSSASGFAASPTGRDIVDLANLSPDMLGLKITSGIINNVEPALRIETKWPVTICIAQLNIQQQHIEQTILNYSAQLKAEGLTGKAYLEMYIHVPGGVGGAFFADGTERTLTGTTADWSKFETSYGLAKDQIPDIVTLNLVIQGTGAIWVKGVKLQRQP